MNFIFESVPPNELKEWIKIIVPSLCSLLIALIVVFLTSRNQNRKSKKDVLTDTAKNIMRVLGQLDYYMWRHYLNRFENKFDHLVAKYNNTITMGYIDRFDAEDYQYSERMTIDLYSELAGYIITYCRNGGQNMDDVNECYAKLEGHYEPDTDFVPTDLKVVRSLKELESLHNRIIVDSVLSDYKKIYKDWILKFKESI